MYNMPGNYPKVKWSLNECGGKSAFKSEEVDPLTYEGAGHVVE